MVDKIKKEFGKLKVVHLVWPVVSILIFVFSLWLLLSGDLESAVSRFGIMAPLVIIVLKASTLVIAPLGGVALYIVSGILFGTWKGLLITFGGDLLGSLVCFYLSRIYGPRAIRLFVGAHMSEQVLKFTSMLRSTKSFLKARVASATVPELLAYAAGLSPINVFKFLALHMPFYVVIDFLLVAFADYFSHLGVQYVYFGSLAIGLIAIAAAYWLFQDYKKLGQETKAN